MSLVEATTITPQVKSNGHAINSGQLDDIVSTVISSHEDSDAHSHTRLTPSKHDEGASSTRLKRIFVRLKPRNPPQVSYELENAGSVARDHLANERTWLAYVRTSLAIAGTGVALVQLFTISPSDDSSSDKPDSVEPFARPLGATTVMAALGVLGIGVYRYFKIQKAMTQGMFPVARSTVITITAVLASLAAIIFGILVAIPT